MTEKEGNQGNEERERNERRTKRKRNMKAKRKWSDVEVESQAVPGAVPSEAGRAR